MALSSAEVYKLADIFVKFIKISQDSEQSGLLNEYNELVSALYGGSVSPTDIKPNQNVQPRKPINTQPKVEKDLPVENDTKSTTSRTSAEARNQKVIAGLNAKMKPLAIKFVELANRNGLSIVLTSGYRSNKEQERLYQQGRTTKGRVVTHAKPGTSKHNHGLAIDIAFLNEKNQIYWPSDNAIWEKAAGIGESLGLKWGGRWSGFKDKPHFEFNPRI